MLFFSFFFFLYFVYNAMCSAVLILMLSCNSVFWFLFHRLFILFFCLAHLAGTLQQQNPKTQLNSDSKMQRKGEAFHPVKNGKFSYACHICCDQYFSFMYLLFLFALLSFSLQLSPPQEQTSFLVSRSTWLAASAFLCPLTCDWNGSHLNNRPCSLWPLTTTPPISPSRK